MIEKIILLTFATAPVLLLLLFVYHKDKYGKEPMRILLRTFFFGCLSVIPAILIGGFFSSLYDSTFRGILSPTFGGVYEGYIVAGVCEEFSKLLLLFLAVWYSKHFNEYFDGIVYAVFVSLGFAAVENVMYVFNQQSFFSSIMTGSMRAILSVPAHFLFGVAMGYWFALAKFNSSRRTKYMSLTFGVPVLLHGTFDSLLMVPGSLGDGRAWLSLVLLPLFVLFDIRLWRSGIRRLKEMQRLSAEQHGDIPDDPPDKEAPNESDSGNRNSQGAPFSGFKWDV